MKTLSEYLDENIVNERLLDGWFYGFEFKSQEKFAAYGPKSFDQYIEDNGYLDENSNYSAGISIKLNKYLGQEFDEIHWNGNYGTMEAKFKNHPNQPLGRCTIAARGKDGKIYSNDSELLEALGLKPKPNKIFDKSSWDENFSKYKVGDCLGIPEYGK